MSDAHPLTQRQVRCLETLPKDHELVTPGRGSPIVRGPKGELFGVKPNGRLVALVESVQSYLQVHG
jgi:hypothetical protein